MNKLTKVGLSALCGSLASYSAAQAGELAVTGSATMTYVSNTGQVTGNPIGMQSSLSFGGSGELDGGQAIAFGVDNDDQNAFSSASMSLTTNSLGTWSLAQATGGQGIDAFDDRMPTAWEETDGAGLSQGADKISGVGLSTNLQYKSPVWGATYLAIAYAPKNDGVVVNDKSTSGSTVKNQAGLDVRANFGTGSAGAFGGAEAFVGYSITEIDPGTTVVGTGSRSHEDREEAVLGAIYTFGPVSAGAQASVEYLGEPEGATAVWGYSNVTYGVSFNVNDDLALSWGRNTSKKGMTETSYGSTVVSTADSYQVAYTMGGAAIKLAYSEVDNEAYTSGTGSDLEATTIAVSLAF